MNCYGTNPRYTQQLQPVNSMNNTTTTTEWQIPSANRTNHSSVMPVNPQNPWNTTTSGEWSQPIPTNPNMPTSPASVPTPSVRPLPPTLTESIYTPGYLRQNIGQLMRVEFLIGNQTTDRVGRLKNVGASFIVLQSLEGQSEIVCDIFSIKFVTIIRDAIDAQMLTAFPQNG